MIEVMMKKLLFLLLLLFGQQLFATKWHLDINETGANTGLTRTDAWDSPDSLELNVAAGDTVIWYSGNYTTPVLLDSIFAGTNIALDTLYNIAFDSDVHIDQNSNLSFFNFTPSLAVEQRNQKILFFKGFKITVDERNFVRPSFSYNMGVHFEGCDIYKTNGSTGRLVEAVDVANFIDCVIDVGFSGFVIPDPETGASFQSCTIINLGASFNFFQSPVTAGKLSLVDVILERSSGTGLFLPVTSSFDAITVARNVRFFNVDTTRFGTEDVADNLLEADSRLDVIDYSTLPVTTYHLGVGSPSLSAGTDHLDIGAIRNGIIQ